MFSLKGPLLSKHYTALLIQKSPYVLSIHPTGVIQMLPIPSTASYFLSGPQFHPGLHHTGSPVFSVSFSLEQFLHPRSLLSLIVAERRRSLQTWAMTPGQEWHRAACPRGRLSHCCTDSLDQFCLCQASTAKSPSPPS